MGITVNRKNRRNWAMVLKTKGKTIYTINKKQVISDYLHPVILPKGCDYSWICIEAGECIIIEFDAEITDIDFNSFEIKENSFIINNFSKIEKSLSRKNIGYKLECICYLNEIILFLLKSIKTEHTHHKKMTSLKPAVKYITANFFDSTITNESLSKLCGMSTVYFRKNFVSVYGISPCKYLHNFRIDKAKAILNSDYDSIEQVAYSVGYNSIYHFSKMFKHYTGLSPSEYAKASRK